EQVVLLRPMNGLISMTLLNYDQQITKPSTFNDEVVRPAVEPEELKLMKTLIDASTPKEFDYAKYKDTYTEKMTKLIEAKVTGQQIVAPPVQEHAQIINLMDALKQSVAQYQQAAPEAEAAKPPKKMAASVRKAETGTRKRKSG